MHDSNFREFKRRYNKSIIKSLEIIGLLLVDRASLLSPVDTGRLRQSISHKLKPLKYAVQFGTDVFYGLFVEKGTYKQKAQPFIKPALIKNIMEFEHVIEKVFKGEL